jgi:hypothetical protein
MINMAGIMATEEVTVESAMPICEPVPAETVEFLAATNTPLL